MMKPCFANEASLFTAIPDAMLFKLGATQGRGSYGAHWKLWGAQCQREVNS
jgi:hypothetical protein